jgi:Copper amine oxidase, enzyme domain
MARTRTPAGTEAAEARLDFEAFGPTQREIVAAARLAARHPDVRRELAGTRNRLLTVGLVETERVPKPARPTPAQAVRATYFDYTNNRTLFVDSRIGAPDAVTVTDSGLQPRPTPEEFADAVTVVREDRELGRHLERESVQPYPPMPPIIPVERPDGRPARVVGVGLLPLARGAPHEIVGVDMHDRRVLRFEGNAPPTAEAHNPICGPPGAWASTTSSAAGQAWVSVFVGGTRIWRFLAVRPAASSGTNGSGVELRYVDFRGRRVLYRAHVPILNVQYDGNACGPYRDWQDQEGALQATGSNPVPGFRLCSTPATTILDTGSDVGNFVGVAVFLQGSDAVLVSEMEAGWYRYVSMWRFGFDGTIKARFGFAAVANSCVCNRHHHHAYWRLDFDVETAGNNVVREFNNPPLVAGSNWHQKTYETRRPRDPARKRRWRVENVTTGRAYDVVPGASDGLATAMPDWPFPRGDVWLLRYRGSEIDDGVQAIGPPYEAGLDAWQNGESLDRKDVVVWYGAHFTHHVHEGGDGHGHGHVVGPDLKPVNW